MFETKIHQIESNQIKDLEKFKHIANAVSTEKSSELFVRYYDTLFPKINRIKVMLEKFMSISF